MVKKNILLIMLALFSFLPLNIAAQCKVENNAFQAGESLTYDLYFNWKFVWVKVGKAYMKTDSQKYNGQDALCTSLLSKGSKTADRFFVMRDTLLCYITKDMVPLYFRKGAEEGKRYTVDEVKYSYADGKCHMKQLFRSHKGEITQRTSTSSDCVYDMASMLQRARSFNPANFKKGQKLKFMMAEGKKVEEQTIIYRGKKRFKMESTNVTYNCLVFSFVEYKDKKEKEVITFYVTDDANHLPVRIDFFLNFGSAKAFLTDMKGVRNPLTSVVKK